MKTVFQKAALGLGCICMMGGSRYELRQRFG